MIDRLRWYFLAVAVAGICILLGIAIANARDLEGKYTNSPNSEWVKSLRSPSGVPCCDLSDGHRLEDVDWRGEPDGTYSVRVEGQWVKLTKDQIIIEPNRIGVAMVWIWMNRVTCFIPGSGS